MKPTKVTNVALSKAFAKNTECRTREQKNETQKAAEKVPLHVCEQRKTRIN